MSFDKPPVSANAADAARKLSDSGRDVVVARLITTSGSAPRHRDAIMVFDSDGTSWGTIGGGIVENEVRSICRKAFSDKSLCTIHSFSLLPKEKNGIGSMCGGAVQISVEFYGKNDSSLLRENVAPPPAQTVYILGAGHIGAALIEPLRYVGFRTIVVDDRPEYASPHRLPSADEVVCVDSLQDAFSNLSIEEDCFIVILTYSHDLDYAVLKDALQLPCTYLGMIGSSRKIKTIFNKLQEDGVTEKQLSKVHTPIGVPITAETPNEIAISIAAEMIDVRARNN